MMKMTVTMGSALAAAAAAFAQLGGGGDLNPDLKPPAAALEKWMDLRVGLSVHWGPSSLGGREISWSRGGQIPKNVYDGYYKSFNPDKFDADEWCRLMKRWGMRYLSPTAKHHDGFALWFSDYSEYDMENAGRKVDILAELRRACDRHGIVLGAYYSNIDWYHPDWKPYGHGGPGALFPRRPDCPDITRYFTYMENQVGELIRKYRVAFVQFDGEWEPAFTHKIGSALYRKFKTINPDVILNSRIDISRRNKGHSNLLGPGDRKYAGDYQDRERLTNRGNNVTEWADYPWQAWVTLDKGQWSYRPSGVRLLGADELIRDLVAVVGCNGNYMINLGPRPDGAFDPEQVALMDKLGAWLRKYGAAVYGTRGGPFLPGKGYVSTRKGKSAWLLVLDPGLKSLDLPLPEERGFRVTDCSGGGARLTPVPAPAGAATWRLDLPEPGPGEPVRVIRLDFRAPVGMIGTKPAPAPRKG